jgi:hypothetical protein
VSIDSIELWHRRARPNPTKANFNVQLGCHCEEIRESLDALEGDCATARMLLDDARHTLHKLGEALKAGRVSVHVQDRKDFLDGLADTIVTAVGTGHCARMNIVEGTRRVDRSNWSKFDEDGNPIFTAAGKVAKNPRTYHEPDLTGLY